VLIQTTTQHCRNTLQCDVTGLVPEFVVDGLQAVQAVLGAEPHVPLHVLRDPEDPLLREAVVEPEALEVHGNRGRRPAPTPCYDQKQRQH
jgi:hypothetical protein